MSPTETLTNPDEMKRVKMLRFPAKWSQFAERAHDGLQKWLGVDTPDLDEIGLSIFDEPETAEIPAPEVEVPAPATEVVEDTTPYWSPTRISEHRQVMLDAKIRASKAKETDIVNDFAHVKTPQPEQTNIVPPVSEKPVGLGARRTPGAGLADFVENATLKSVEAPVEEAAATTSPVETVAPAANGLPTRDKGAGLDGFKQNLSTPMPATETVAIAAPVETAPALVEVPVAPTTTEAPSPAFDPLTSPIEEVQRVDALRDPLNSPYHDSSQESAPLGDNLEKKYDLMELRQRAMHAAVNTGASYAEGHGLEAAALSAAYNGNNNPNMLT